MITILPVAYVASAGAGVVSLAAYLVCLGFRASRRWRLSLALALLASVFICSLSAISLGRFTHSLRGKFETIPFDISKTEAVAIFGAPTEKIEPAFGANQVPVPNSAVWHYEVHVWPFQFHGRLEFIDDTLISR